MKIEAFNCLVLLSITCILLIFTWKVLNRVWIKPKKLEKILRAKGFKGKPYRFLVGDIKETAVMAEEAKSKPINFTNNIIPRVLPFLHNLVKDYGKNSFTWVGPDPAIIIFEPDLIREVLAKNYVYQKTRDPFSGLLAEGLFNYDKDKWAKHRKIINPAFNLEKLKLMLPAFHLSCSEMLSKWDMISSKNEGSFELDVWPYILNLTSDAISRTAFGSNYEEGEKIFELQKELINHIFQYLNTLYVPGMLYLPTKRNRRIKAITKEIQTTVLRIVNRKMNAIRNGEGGDDLLGILLKSNLNEIHEKGNEKWGMSFEEVIEECKLFYLAGQETTATLLVWTLILLGKHLDWQERAREEVRQIFAHKIPDFEGLNHLKVMTMIINEVLRLYPPGVILERKIDEDTILGKQTLPAGIQLFLPVIMLHHDESIWGADAKEFKPERFSDGVVKATKRGEHVYFPFSSGPRFCIGEKFAMLEAKMALSLILQRFSFELSSLYTHAPFAIVTLQPQHGAHLVMHKL